MEPFVTVIDFWYLRKSSDAESKKDIALDDCEEEINDTEDKEGKVSTNAILWWTSEIMNLKSLLQGW